MVKRGVEADIRKLEVEIDRPVDRAGKQDKLRSDDITNNVTGSGLSKTVITTNNSELNWYLEHATVAAQGSALALGDLAVHVGIQDGGNNTVSELVCDPAVFGSLEFHGAVIKPGWDVYVSVDQADANTHVVHTPVLIRRGTDPTGGSGPISTVTPTSAIDEFEQASVPSAAYTGDTGNFSKETANVYGGEGALKSTTPGSQIHSDEGDGLDNYPEYGKRWEYYVHSNQGKGSATDSFSRHIWNRIDADSMYYIELLHHTDAWRIRIENDGAPFTTDSDFSLPDGHLKADTWYRVVVEHIKPDDKLKAELHTTGPNAELLSVLTSVNTPLAPTTSVGWEHGGDAGSEIIFDEGTLIE